MKTKAEVDALLKNVGTLEGRAAAAEQAVATKDARIKELETEREKALAGAGWQPVSRSGSSDEARAMRYFGASHVRDLMAVNCGDPRWKNVPGECKLVVLELKKSVDIARMISQLFHGAPMDQIGKLDGQDRLARVPMLDNYFGKNVLAPRLKSFGSTVSGFGDEWVPTLISSQYINEYELEYVLEQRFRQTNMLSNPYDLPVQTGVTKARKIAENTQATDAAFGTDKLRFTATKSVEYYVLPEELNEDSAPDIMALGRDEIVRAQVRAWEAAIINGDDDGTHIDSDTQAAAADVAEKFAKGLRRQALANSANGSTVDFSNAAITTAGLRTMRSRAKKFAVTPKECMWLVGPAVNAQLLDLPNVNTVDKMGPQATVLEGTLSSYGGIGVVVSQYMREDLNASGVYDGVTTNRAGVILVNRERWHVGTRRPIRVKIMEDLAYHDRWLMASYQRKDFQGHTQSATELSVVYGINIAV